MQGRCAADAARPLGLVCLGFRVWLRAKAVWACSDGGERGLVLLACGGSLRCRRWKVSGYPDVPIYYSHTHYLLAILASLGSRTQPRSSRLRRGCRDFLGHFFFFFGGGGGQSAPFRLGSGDFGFGLQGRWRLFGLFRCSSSGSSTLNLQQASVVPRSSTPNSEKPKPIGSPHRNPGVRSLNRGFEALRVSHLQIHGVFVGFQ